MRTLSPRLPTESATAMTSGASKNDTATAAGDPEPPAGNDSQSEVSVMAYLRSRGFGKALAALQAEMDVSGRGLPDKAAADARLQETGGSTVGMAELASKNAPRDPREKDAAETGPSSALENAGAQALLLDPTDTTRGFAIIKTWCTGSLDIYQPELLPLLLPLFVHSYLNLVDMGLGAAGTSLTICTSDMQRANFSSTMRPSSGRCTRRC